MNVPTVKFATTSDDVRIAYTVWGEGPPLVIVPPIISNVEVVWENAIYRRVFERLGRHVSVIAFDKRGIGMSDSFEVPPSNDQRIRDFHAVMDAEEVSSAHISGISEGGLMALILAVSHPERVDGLVVANSSAPPDHLGSAAELADLPPMEASEWHGLWDQVTEHWGEPESPTVPWLMPSLADDEPFRIWQARYERQAATRAGFRRQLESLNSLDTTGLPQQITAPALVTHTTGDRVFHAGHGRQLAKLIPGARYIEFPGPDHFWWAAPNWRDIVDSHIEFITGNPPTSLVARTFATLLFTDIVGSTSAATGVGDQEWAETISRHDHIASRIITQYSGAIVKSTGDGLLATFPSPSLAVGAARSFRAELETIGLTIRAGIHAGEIEHRDNDVSGLAVSLAARVEETAPSKEVYVTSTVRELLIGGSFDFEDAGHHELKGFTGSWHLYRLT
jgi:class 3 adenylate cyclase/pimeloyl-ACP methyl ester carboxylesterase